MRTLSDAALAHFQQSVTTIALCWRIERRDGGLVLGTEHDRDLTIVDSSLAGTYLAETGITGSNVVSNDSMAVDNLDVKGALKESGLSVLDLSAADLEAGLFDDATATTFLVNWAQPDEWQVILRTGTLGNVTRTAEGQYTTELRGLAQALTRPFIRTYAVNCDADLFDARCKVIEANFTFTGTVSAVTDRRMFSILLDGSPVPADAAVFTGGRVRFTSGGNDGFTMEVKTASQGSPEVAVVLFQPMPLDVQVGDTLEIRYGCDKLKATCKDTFNNLVNFRGHGVFTPGINEILKVGGQTGI